MSYTFDGVAKKIYLPSGMTVLDLQDLYSRWKDWVRTSDNSKYPLAFYAVGGDVVEIPLYLFEQNGWYTIPQQADHTLEVVGGVFVRDGGGDPFSDPTGDYNIRVNRQVPGIAIGYSLNGPSISVDQIADEVMLRMQQMNYLTVTKFLGLK